MNRNTDQTERLAFSLTEAAAASGISRRTLESYAAIGRLRTKKIGGRRIVLRKDLLAFLRHNQPFAAPGKKRAPAVQP